MIKNVAKGTEMCAVGTLLHATQQADLFFTSSGKHQLIEQCSLYNVDA